jgi:hypothetical protein
MKRLLKASGQGLVVAVCAYFLLWFFWFIRLTGAEYGLLEEYFRLSWSGGGEIVTSIQVLSVFPSLFIGLGVTVYAYRKIGGQVPRQ